MDGRHMTHRSEIPPTNQPAPKKAAPKIANLNKNVAQGTNVIYTRLLPFLFSFPPCTRCRAKLFTQNRRQTTMTMSMRMGLGTAIAMRMATL